MNLYVYVGNNGVNFVDPSGMAAKEIGIVVISIHPSYDVGGAIGGTALYVKGVYEGNEEYKKHGIEGALESLSGLVKPSKKIKKGGEVVKVVDDKVLKKIKEAKQKVIKKQAPKEIDRIDRAHDNKHGQWHVHEKKTDASYNLDGSLHDKNKGTPNFSKKTIEWLNEHGWNIKP